MKVERAGRRGRGGLGFALVAWLVVLGGTVALGVAGRGGDGSAPPTAAPAAVVPATLAAVVPPTAAPSIALNPPRTPLPTQPPIGEDGIMGGLPFGTAWHWLQPD